MVRNPATIVKIITEAHTLDQACEGLVEAANAAGGSDNIGVVLAEIT